MIHSSRSDGDKMLADMAEGSADYSDQDRYDGEDYDGDDDFSGSGDHHDGVADGEFHAENVTADSSIIILFVIHLGKEPPVVQPYPPGEQPRFNNVPISASGTLRISLALAISSAIVISFKF